MGLAPDQIVRYETDGFALLTDLFQPAEVNRLRDAVEALAATEAPGRVLERDGHTVRALHGCHLADEACDRLTRLPRMVGVAEQLIGGRVYVYQFKVNFKAAFGGDVWQWHQDYIFWRKEDGMLRPHVVNLMLFLDDVTEFNGPLMLIPGSHRHGMIDVPALPADGAAPSWVQNVSARLKYSLDRDAITRLVADGGIVAPKGRAGSALVFHPNIAHASVPNLSPFARTMLIVTYNSVDNVPVPSGEPRPEFLVSRDTAAIVPMAADQLVAS